MMNFVNFVKSFPWAPQLASYLKRCDKQAPTNGCKEDSYQFSLQNPLKICHKSICQVTVLFEGHSNGVYGSGSLFGPDHRDPQDQPVDLSKYCIFVPSSLFHNSSISAKSKYVTAYFSVPRKAGKELVYQVEIDEEGIVNLDRLESSISVLPLRSIKLCNKDGRPIAPSSSTLINNLEPFCFNNILPALDTSVTVPTTTLHYYSYVDGKVISSGGKYRLENGLVVHTCHSILGSGGGVLTAADNYHAPIALNYYNQQPLPTDTDNTVSLSRTTIERSRYERFSQGIGIPLVKVREEIQSVRSSASYWLKKLPCCEQVKPTEQTAQRVQHNSAIGLIVVTFIVDEEPQKIVVGTGALFGPTQGFPHEIGSSKYVENLDEFSVVSAQHNLTLKDNDFLSLKIIKSVEFHLDCHDGTDSILSKETFPIDIDVSTLKFMDDLGRKKDDYEYDCVVMKILPTSVHAQQVINPSRERFTYESCVTPCQGDAVFLVSFELGHRQVFAAGEILEVDGEGIKLVYTCPSDRGSSGGILINRAGLCCGLHRCSVAKQLPTNVMSTVGYEKREGISLVSFRNVLQKVDREPTNNVLNSKEFVQPNTTIELAGKGLHRVVDNRTQAIT